MEMNPVYFCKRTLNPIINNGGPMMLDAGIAKNKGAKRASSVTVLTDETKD